MLPLIPTVLSLLTPIVSSPTVVPISYSYSHIIGYYATVSNVTTNTKIIVGENDAGLLRSVGRTVYPNQPSGPSSNPTYYYWATPSTGKVTSIRQIRNDVDSLFFMLTKLEDLAHNVCPSYFTDIPNNILGYVRSFNRDYTDLNDEYSAALFWANLAGNISTTFAQLIEQNDNNQGLSFSQYFGAFLNSSQYCSDRNNKYHVDYCDPDQNPSTFYNLIDPYEHNRRLTGQSTKTDEESTGIDLIKLFASLDTCYFDDDIFGGLYGYTDRGSTITTWGGDLQREVVTTQIWEDLDNFETTLSGSYAVVDGGPGNGGKMRYPTFNADLDALNIGRWQTMSPAHNVYYNYLSTILKMYYSNDVVVTNHRYLYFVEKTVENGWLSSVYNTQAETFERLAINVLGVEIDSNTLFPTDCSRVADPSFVGLYTSPAILPDSYYRYYFGLSFAHYVLYYAGIAPVAIPIVYPL